MRKVFLSSLIAGCFLVSCTDAGNNTTSKSSMSDSASMSAASRAKEGMAAVYKAIETGDVSRVDSFIDEDFVDHYAPPDGREVRGRDSIKAIFANMHNQVKDMKFDIITSGGDEDYAMAVYHVTGTTTVPMMGMPANTKIDSRGVDVVKLKNGKATEHWEYDDPKEMMQLMQMPHAKMDSTKHK